MKGCNRKDKGNWKILTRGIRKQKSKEDQIQIKEHNKERGKMIEKNNSDCEV